MHWVGAQESCADTELLAGYLEKPGFGRVQWRHRRTHIADIKSQSGGHFGVSGVGACGQTHLRLRLWC